MTESTMPRGRRTSIVARAPEVLVVDDDPDIVAAISSILSAEGMTVTEARNGREALETLQASQPDVVLSDISMPIVDGVELCRCLRARSPELRVVLMTGDLDRRAAGLAAGATHVLAKPLDIETVLDAIAEALGDGGHPRS